MHPLLAPSNGSSRPIWFVTKETLAPVVAGLPDEARAFLAASGFEAKPGSHIVVPMGAGLAALFGLEGAAAGHRDPLLPGKLVTTLPGGLWHFANAPDDPRLATLGWLMGSYRFTRYKDGGAAQVQLVPPDDVDADEVSRIAQAVALGRDLIATPANDLGPDELAAAARALADRHGAVAHTVAGEALERDFPMVHAVGRAAARAPRLVDMIWGDPGRPKVTLVGKGVVFDSGGLNIKPEAAMLLMKKDMGGAASVLALADMIMGAGLELRLRVILPIAENAISGSAFRPGDVLRSRKGLTVEIGNTDAEGRLILADALALADEDAPDLVIDMATLTGAARVALGPDLPALFTKDEETALALHSHGLAEADPSWRLPLWRPYEKLLDSKVADINHISGGPFAGSVTAALFLSRFVEKARAHVHLDMFCWNPTSRPGRPEGAEVMSARAVFAYLKAKLGVL
jgi:leucyl aminopeptidase